jgi:hypothetical protein
MRDIESDKDKGRIPSENSKAIDKIGELLKIETTYMEGSTTLQTK